MLGFGGCGHRQRKDWAVYRRAMSVRAPSALHQEQIALVKREDVKRLERNAQAFCYRARPTRVPSAPYQAQIARVKREGVERLERSDKNK